MRDPPAVLPRRSVTCQAESDRPFELVVDANETEHSVKIAEQARSLFRVEAENRVLFPPAGKQEDGIARRGDVLLGLEEHSPKAAALSKTAGHFAVSDDRRGVEPRRRSIPRSLRDGRPVVCRRRFLPRSHGPPSRSLQGSGTIRGVRANVETNTSSKVRERDLAPKRAMPDGNIPQIERVSKVSTEKAVGAVRIMLDPELPVAKATKRTRDVRLGPIGETEGWSRHPPHRSVSRRKRSREA